MKVAIGILAHNERDCIAELVSSLSRQTLLTEPRADLDAVEILCVPNGCSDDTAAVAQEALTSLQVSCPSPVLSVKVCELEQAGKPNAWNEFVHRLSDQSADFLILMDADIYLTEARALDALIDVFAESPEVYAAVGVPKKRVRRNGKLSIAERLSLGISEVSSAGPPSLNGGLYCGRGPILRRIWLPAELLSEDGYVKAMLVTDFFTSPDDPSRLVRAAGAAYEFEPYLKPIQLFRHQRRLLVGSAVNVLLYTRLWSLSDGDAGEYARRQSEADVEWFNRLLDEHLQGKRGWVLPAGFVGWFLFKRFRKLKYLTAPRAIKGLPIVIAAMLFELPVLLAVNAEFKKRSLKW